MALEIKWTYNLLVYNQLLKLSCELILRKESEKFLGLIFKFKDNNYDCTEVKIFNIFDNLINIDSMTMIHGIFI